MLSLFNHVWLCVTHSSPGSSVQGILQVRILVWVAMPCSRGSSWPRDQTHISHRSCIAGGFFTAEPPGWANRSPLKPGSGISSSRKVSLTTSSLRWVPSRHQSPVLTSITTLTQGHCMFPIVLFVSKWWEITNLVSPTVGIVLVIQYFCPKC